MSKTKNTIKINGHTYDAVTGVLIKSASNAKPITKKPVSVTHATSSTKKPEAKPTLQAKPPSASTPRAKAKFATRAPKHSQTLMRQSVKRATNTKYKENQSSIRAVSKLVKSNSAVIAVKKSAHKVDDSKFQRARNISKSKSIVKFSKTGAKTLPLLKAKPIHSVEPVKKTPAQPRPSDTTTTNHPQTLRPLPTRQKTTTNLLQEAINHASSHNQPVPRRRKTAHSQRLVGLGAIVVIAGALIAIAVGQGVPNLKMRIASAKAGFSAGLPGNSPAGFHLGDMSYGAGAVAVSYKSNSDNARNFKITQKKSSWDSATLQSNFVEKRDRDFRVVEDGGLTIYLYGHNNATWMDQGIWYQVQGNGSLGDKQLVDIAKSL